MISAVNVYEVFSKAVGKEAARVLASYLEEVEKRKAATSEELRETELRLRKEIEQIRLEVEQVKLEIEQVRSEFGKRNFGSRNKSRRFGSDFKRKSNRFGLNFGRRLKRFGLR